MSDDTTRDWLDAQRLVNAGYAFCRDLDGHAVLASRETMTIVGTVDEVRSLLDRAH